MNYSDKITGTAVSQPNVVLALSLYMINVQENPPLVIGGSEGTSPASLSMLFQPRLVWPIVMPNLNFLISAALSLVANDAYKWGVSIHLSDRSYPLMLALWPAHHLFITHYMCALACSSSPASSLHSTQYKRCYQLIWFPAMIFPEIPVPLNNPPLLFPTNKHLHYPNMHSILSQ